MRIGRTAAAVSSAAVLVGSALAMASPASAGQTWIQSVQRPSAEAACPTSSGPVSQSGWVVTDWSASWELWANGGTGGWTCTRSITWAKDTPVPDTTDPDAPEEPSDPSDPPAGLCYEFNAGVTWVSFAGGNPILLPADIAYGNASCTGPVSSISGTGFKMVYAPDGPTALAMCGGAPWTLVDYPAADPNIWGCAPASS